MTYKRIKVCFPADISNDFYSHLTYYARLAMQSIYFQAKEVLKCLQLVDHHKKATSDATPGRTKLCPRGKRRMKKAIMTKEPDKSMVKSK